MTPTRAVLAAALLGVALIISGVTILAGVAWALIAAGILVLAGAVLLYDPKASK